MGRGGKRLGRFALSRARELASRELSFGGLLAGDTWEMDDNNRVEAGGKRKRDPEVPSYREVQTVLDFLRTIIR